LRIEDVDGPRCVAGMDAVILAQLAACGLHADEPPWHQATRGALYAQAAAALREAGHAYPCSCTRREIDDVLNAGGTGHERHAERVYPGTCRGGLHGKPARALRLRVPGGDVQWHDRRLGAQVQDVAREVGDFVLQRADGPWAYQLAVVVDDAAQGVTHVVRGEDLADNTARQIVLQRLLGLPTPRYLHTPVVMAADGHKLSKQNGATALDTTDPLAALRAAGSVLGLPALPGHTPADWLAAAMPAWAGIIAALSSNPELS